MTEPDRSPPDDELTQRYREASAQDARRPGAQVREAVRAHAQMVIEAGRQAKGPDDAPQTPAANQPRWKISALAGLALAGLTGLLVLQYDRGTDEEKDLAFGQPSMSAPPAPAPAAPVPVAPKAPLADNRSAKAVPSESPAAALKAPAAPATAKPAAQPSVTGSAAPKAESEAAPAPPASALPSQPPPPPSLPEVATRDSAQAARPAGQADTVLGGMAAPAPMPQAAARAAPPAPAPAPTFAPQPAAPVAAPAPAAPAAAIPERRRDKFSAPNASLRAEESGIPRLAGALQNAARAGDLPQVERLLQQGAALNAADAAGRTPLMLAAIQGHTAVVQRLLAAGANTGLIDRDGLNAQQHARRLGYDGIAHLIEAAR